MKYFTLIKLLALFAFVCGCSPKSQSLSDMLAQAPGTRHLLYVASGSCYAGGAPTSVGSGTIAAFNTIDGRMERMVIDYNSFSPGDNPVSIVDYDTDHLLVLVENAAGRRIDIVNKAGSTLTTYLANAAGLNAVMRSMTKLADNSLLVSKSNSIEKFSVAKARVLQGASPYVNAPGLGCATSTTLISSVTTLPNGKILFAHSAATPNNKLALISSTGYATTADCLTSQAAPNTTAMPSALLFHSSGKLLAAYGSSTASSNFVYAYDVDMIANTISNPTAAFNDASTVNGPSAIAEDPTTGEVYVANGNQNFNTIEKFTFDPTTKLLSRVPGQPFLGSQIYTRCVSDMKVLTE